MKTYSYEELKDSRILYDKQPPALMPIVVVLIALLMAVLVILSVFTNKTYIVKSQGVIVSEDKNYVTCGTNGSFIDCRSKEGEVVSEGDIIAAIDPIGSFENETYYLKANKSGTLHFIIPYAEGKLIQAGETLAVISSNNDIYIETYIASENRARVEIGNEVDIVINGLLQSEYGTIKGKLIEIDSDATIGESGSVAFKAKVKPSQNFLNSQKGKRVNIVPGMTSELRVKYDEISYFKYIAEWFGIRF